MHILARHILLSKNYQHLVKSEYISICVWNIWFWSGDREYDMCI